MITKFFEGTDEFNYGKFMLGKMEDFELCQRSKVDDKLKVNTFLLETSSKFWILDLQTKEAAFFDLRFDVIEQLEKHQIWVCPMFPLFLKRCEELYIQNNDISEWEQLQIFLPGKHNALRRERQLRKEGA